MVTAVKDDFDEFIEMIEKSDDRAAAILCASLLNRTLQEALMTHMRPTLFLEERDRIFRKNGPLATFHSRIVLADALSIIDEYVSADLFAILKVTTTFEHRDYWMLIDLGPKIYERLKMKKVPQNTRGALIEATKRIGKKLMDYSPAKNVDALV
jgi:hypothetical protein